MPVANNNYLLAHPLGWPAIPKGLLHISLFLWVTQVKASAISLTLRSPLVPTVTWQPNSDDSTPPTDFRSLLPVPTTVKFKTSLPLAWALTGLSHHLFSTVISNSIKIIFLKVTQSFLKSPHSIKIIFQKHRSIHIHCWCKMFPSLHFLNSLASRFTPMCPNQHLQPYCPSLHPVDLILQPTGSPVLWTSPHPTQDFCSIATFPHV